MSRQAISRLAFVGLDRNIYLTDLPGGSPVQLTAPLPKARAGWAAMLASAPDGFSWPTWSPDGKWLAALAVEIESESSPTRLVTMSVDGLRHVEWAEFAEMTPIYLQWHPSGHALSLLLQRDRHLVLGLVDSDELGKLHEQETGVPLFFNWSADGAHLLVHAGDREEPGGKLLLRARQPELPHQLLSAQPGSFCAPVFVQGRAVYTLHRSDGQSDVVVSAPDGSDPRTLLTRRGLMALVAAPQGQPIVAISAAPRGEGTPYVGIDLLNIETGECRPLTAAECFAFFWSPTSDYLLYAVIDVDASCVRWCRLSVETGESVDLGSFWPTRDSLFYLHFFDQYAGSHPIISADGRYLAFAGYPAGDGQADLSSPPRIFVKDLREPTLPTFEAGRGSIAVFAPAPL